ncbi:juvenile hormone esterase-like [Pectinophora gossypiella]|uniref:juvenile hormone esterase-like n=1 Tax=Pectinophora gossypiella TaxID=13191 RepID=UPI00214E40C7|nr:juvenile hormone esterase-like [Pectinophora gossypiella]
MKILRNVIFPVILILFHNVESKTKVDPLVDTNVGLIRGQQATDGDYSMFMGIPYAKISDSNPFGPSTPYEKFETIFEAYDDTATCPYVDLSNNIFGSLDCLTLNIYVPNSASSSNLMPVMVYIYGGNFERGSAEKSMYGPKFLVRHDVILVVINHRIGLYGFMCLHIPEVPGNQGLKDQVLALRWIKDNIQSFGGDANKITIFGESSGGRSVDFHLISPQEKLFNNAILQSGTSLTRDTIFEADTEAPLKLAEKLGFPTDSVYEALSYLSTVQPKLVIAASIELDLVIKPCVEKDIENVEKFITDYTYNLDIPKAKDTPVLLGYNDHEQVARYADKPPEFFNDLNIIYERLKDYFNFGKELDEKVKNVHHFYLGDEAISPETMWEIINFDSVFSYNHPTERTIKMYLENGAKDIYYYVFSYVGGRNFYKDGRNVTVGGASHADELGYLFDMQSKYSDDPSEEDQLTIDRITTLWTNFAKFSNPTPETSELLPIQWEPVTKDIYYFYNIGSEVNLEKRPFHKDTAFWDLFYKENWKFQKGYRERGSK